MEPRIISLGPILVAGVGGDGEMTAALWSEFEARDKARPIANKTGGEGYEIRSYLRGRCNCFVGVPVKDEAVPAGYALKTIPEGVYACFDIRPAQGWQANNAAMDQWLRENRNGYRQAAEPGTGVLWVAERYDGRFRGMDDPESVLEMLIPVTPAGQD